MLSKSEKVEILNLMCVVDYDIEGSTVTSLLIDNDPNNVERLLEIGVPESEILEMTSDDGELIDISVMAFHYGEAEWFENGEFLDYTP